MAGSLHVRNLDDELIARLKRSAVRHGRSAEARRRRFRGRVISLVQAAGEADITFRGGN